MGIPNYGATTAKAALQVVGVLANRRVRGPLVGLDPGEADALRQGLVAAELLCSPPWDPARSQRDSGEPDAAVTLGDDDLHASRSSTTAR